MTKASVQTKTALVLSNYWMIGGWKAMLVSSNGRQDELSCFTHDEDSATDNSCGLTWKNMLYIFGGEETKKQQISKLVRYKMQVIGNLPFEFDRGACTNMASRKFFLCFEIYDYRRCHWSTDPLGDYNDVPQSFHDHRRITISSSERKFPIFVHFFTRN